MNPWPSPWSVEIRQHGRSGSIVYDEAAGSISFYWELGGGDTVALIWGQDHDHWTTHHRWSAGRRRVILERVAEAVIRRQAPSCRFEIEEPQGLIRIREGSI